MFSSIPIQYLIQDYMVSSNNFNLIRIPICLHTVIWYQVFLSNVNLAKSTGAVEYTDWFSAEGKDLHFNRCPKYNPKKSDMRLQ